MKREVIIVDNFYRDPQRIVAYARSLRYYNPWACEHRGSSAPEHMATAPWTFDRKRSSVPRELPAAVWHSSFFKRAHECPFKSSRAFIATLEDIIGEEIDLEHWTKDFPENPDDGTVITPRPDLIDPHGPVVYDNLVPGATSCRWNCAFHTESPLGTGVHNHIADTWNAVGPHGWTGLIYLNENAPRNSGLKTFRNKHGNDLEWMTPAHRWQLLDDYANVYNRLLLVRGWMPHAGGSGFGDSIFNGRFYQTLFFKTNATREFRSWTVFAD